MKTKKAEKEQAWVTGRKSPCQRFCRSETPSFS